MSTFMIIVLAWIAVSALATAVASVFLRAAARADADTDRLARSALATARDPFGERAPRSLARETEGARSRRLQATLH